MRKVISFVALTVSVPLVVFACDDDKKSVAPAPSASATSVTTAASSAPPAEPTDAGRAPAPASTWDGSMPERPVPKSSPTVSANYPPETQLKAVAYMAAMAQPRYDDAFPDGDWIHSLVERLKPIALSMDKGPASEKSKMSGVTEIGGGRRIDIMLAGGCDAEMPARIVQGRAGASFPTLLSHGVLVIACHDAHVQCLQSTRDPTDVLCTTAPRHH